MDPQNTRLLEALLEHARVIVYVKTRGGRFTYMNRFGLEVLGRSLDEVLSATASDIVGAETARRLEDQDQHVLRTGETVTIETVQDTPEGRRELVVQKFPLRDADGSIDALGAIAYDVTALHDAQRRLEERERHLVAAQRLARVASYEWDVETDGLFVSDEFYRLFGVTKGEVPDLLTAFAARVYPPDLQGATARVREAIRSGEPFEDEFRVVLPDGALRTLRSSVEPVRHGDRTVRMRGALHDISDRVERERSERQARQLQRLESIGRLAGGISHDFNNLLSVILNVAAYVHDELPKTSPLRDELLTITGAAEQGALLTRQLLDFSQRRETLSELLDVGAVVEGLAPFLRRTLAEHVELEVRSQPGLAKVMANRGQLEQVLVNLALNAREAMPAGGRLAIETTGAELDRAFCVEHPGAMPGAYVRVRVRDTGTGMAPDVLERAFEPFFTTKAHGSGTGLGLAAVYGIVKDAGGYVGIESARGQGTCVDVYLPVASD